MQTSDYIPVSHPALLNLQSCETWLSVKRFADPEQACTAFLALLDEIEDAPPAAENLLGILERLRLPMQAALEELERRYAGKPLPLAAPERPAFNLACDLWLAQVRAWRRLQRAARKNETLGGQTALLAQRVLEACAGRVYTHLAAHHEVGAEAWRWLHQSYVLAESKGLADAVPSEDAGERSLNCTTIYVSVLLARLANAYALAPREFAWVRKWAARWASKVNLWRSAETGGGLAVDLAGNGGPAWLPAGMPGSTLRFLDCARLNRSLRVRKNKLAEGVAPSGLGLGRDCPPHAARDLIDHLLHCWSNTPLAREFPRRPAGGTSDIVAGFPDIYQALTGISFDSGVRTWDYSQHAMDQIHVFQHSSDAPLGKPAPINTESWEALDESANGFRLRRPGTGVRVALGQLIAIRPRGANQFILCKVRWLSQEADGAVNAGAKALPGLPQACAIRASATDAAKAGPWTQAFILPLTKGLAPNLVLPLGWFQQQREIEMRLDDAQFRVRLEEVTERGHDFHRARFTALASM